MSWSEIKKSVNSDLETPLDTLITNNTSTITSAISDLSDNVDTTMNLLAYDGFTTISSSVSSTGTTELLNIQGKGVLDYLYFYHYAEGGSSSYRITYTTTITIDGVVSLVCYCMPRGTSSSSDPAGYWGILQESMLHKNYDTSSSAYIYSYGNILASSIMTSLSTLDFPSTTTQTTAYSTTTRPISCALVDGYIPFNESLVVSTVVTYVNSGGATFHARYKLIE